ncbi:MAG: imidazole glycerol phosphate synthase subunit HisF [Christensenellaceae bacterium]|jgi:cyclase|nr:imidazole glycerol phosphate synthase subunit HisF [Christensenellaceae bacterium]
MLAKRIIPCLDVKDGRVVKGTNFINILDAGDPVECAKAYNAQGADEVVFLDITASHEKRKTICNIVSRTAEEVFIPLTVGGGIATVADMKAVLRSGADKISVNSAAIKDPSIIRNGADAFGSQCIVLACDVKRSGDRYTVYVNGGRIDTGLDALTWIRTAAKLGAGEILLTSMDADGTKNGYDNFITKTVAEYVNVPIIASGGAGKLQDFYDVLTVGAADAALAASLFHYGTYTVRQVKDFLSANNVPVRL